jgi:tripartite ATP-independent transporter DctP family solute receptor
MEGARMKTTRSRFIGAGTAAGAFASIGVLRWPGDAAQFSYKLANDQTATHPMTAESVAAAKRILDASGGQLEIQVFPDSALGGDPQMLAQARTGAIELLQTGNNILSSILPAAALFNIPFAFHSGLELQSAANGPLGAYVGDAVEKLGLHKFPRTFYGGTFQIQNSLRPIDGPADLRGMKIRVPPGQLDVATFKALGVAPTVVSLAEVYTSLMTHLVDGLEAPLPTLQNFKFYEQVKYCAMTNHTGLAYFMLANGDAWQRLPAKLQDLVQHEFTTAAATASTAFADQETTIAATLAREGMSFTHPAAEPFRAIIRSAGLYAGWRAQFDPSGWDALEKTTGPLSG